MLSNCLGTPSSIRHIVESWAEVPEKPAVVRNRALSNVKILAVEDHADTRLLLKIFLERSGADVIAVESGPAALLVIQRHKFDVALCDIGMPVVINSYERCETWNRKLAISQRSPALPTQLRQMLLVHIVPDFKRLSPSR